MRRLVLVVVALYVGSALMPGSVAADHGTPDHPYRFSAYAVVDSDPDPDFHSLFINRVSGWGQFDNFQFQSVIDCEGRVVTVTLSTASGHSLRYAVDEDITDAFGILYPTDESRQYRGFGIAAGVPPTAIDPASADVEVGIVEGQFHRLGAYMEVDMTLDVRVVTIGEFEDEVVCQTDEARQPKVRMTLHVLSFGFDNTGFTMAGDVRRLGDLPGDATPVARGGCGVVSPHSTRVTEPPVGGPGRDDFHPCPPEGQINDPPPTPPYPSDDCDSGTNVVTGYVGDSFVKLRTAAPNATTTWICVAAQKGETHVGGKAVVGGAGPGVPDVLDEDAASVEACDAEDSNVRLSSGTVLGGQPYWFDVTPSADGGSEVWVCVRFTATVGYRLKFSTAGGDLPVGFTADSSVPKAYTEDPWPAATQPSADCKDNLAGTRTRHANLTVGASQVALYSRQDGARTHLCVRGPGSGGRLTLDSAASPGVSQVLTTSTTDMTPCVFDIFTRDETPSFGIWISDPFAPGPPISGCLILSGSGVRVSAARSDPATVTWAPDTA